MYTVPPVWISSNPSPLSASCPRPPLVARSRLSVIGDPPLTIEPETCADVAASAAALLAATISPALLAATPLPEEELPQPPIPAPRRPSARAARAGNQDRAGIAGGHSSRCRGRRTQDAFPPPASGRFVAAGDGVERRCLNG